jgi:hypothetical protein
MVALKIIQSLNHLLKREGHAALNVDTVKFALDSDVKYAQQKCLVPRSKLVNGKGINLFFKEVSDGGPSWIHANLIQTDNHNHILTIRVGAKIGNENPTINVSLETNSVAFIVDSP